MVAPWRALLLSLLIGLPLAGLARAQDWGVAPAVPDMTEGMAGSAAVPADMAYSDGPAPMSPGSTNRVVLPNPAAQAPPSSPAPSPQLPPLEPQPPSLTPLPALEPPSAPYAPLPPSLATDQGSGFAACEESQSAAQSAGPSSCCHPLWTLHADAVFLTRSSPPDKSLVGDGLGGTLLNANQLDPGTATGWDISVIRRRAWGCWGIEALYFDDGGWNSSNTFTAPGPAVVDFAAPLGVGKASIFSSAYSSRLRNVEVNGRYELAGWLDFIAGFRYIELGESLGITESAIAGLPAASTASYAITAHNRLAGFQLGLDAHLWDYGRFSLDGTVKAGIFGDDADNSTLVTLPLAASLASSAGKSRTAGAAELDFAATYRFTDCWAVRGGYQLLWIDGAALATNQVAVSNPLAGTATVDTNATAFYHGAFVGLEFRR